MKPVARTLFHMGVLLIAFHQHSLAQSAADPSQLPVASRQTPKWAIYETLGPGGTSIRNAPLNTYYHDPVTNVIVRKITAATLPAPVGANRSMWNEYAEGGPFISREWGTGQHSLIVRFADNIFSQPVLVDYQRGVGAGNYRYFPGYVANRLGPYPREQLSSTFSSVNPRILYFTDTDPTTRVAKLFRFNTELMTLQGDGIIIDGMKEIPEAFDGTMNWLQASSDDRWLVFQVCFGDPCVVTKVIAFDHTTGIRHIKSCLSGSPDYNFECGTMDEPHILRAGNYVVLLDGGGGEAGCTHVFGDQYSWHLWDLNNPSAPAVCKTGVYGSHVAGVKNYFVNVDGAESWSPNIHYSPATDTRVETAYYSDPLIHTNPPLYGFVASHRAGQWIQPIADLTQWYWGSNYYDGDVRTLAWAQCTQAECGSNYQGIYRTVPADCDRGAGVDMQEVCDVDYQKPTIGIKAAYQTVPGNPNRMANTLSSRTSIAAMSTTPGTFYHRTNVPGVPHRLYVRPFTGAGATPYNVSFFAPTALHRGIGVGRVNGTDLRLLCHHYSWLDDYPETDGYDYGDVPFATTSPDGKLVMFHSNMGARSFPFACVNTLCTGPGEPCQCCSGVGAGTCNGTEIAISLARTDVFIAEVPLAAGGGGGGCGNGAQTLGPPICE